MEPCKSLGLLCLLLLQIVAAQQSCPPATTINAGLNTLLGDLSLAANVPSLPDLSQGDSLPQLPCLPSGPDLPTQLPLLPYPQTSDSADISVPTLPSLPSLAPDFDDCSAPSLPSLPDIPAANCEDSSESYTPSSYDNSYPRYPQTPCESSYALPHLSIPELLPLSALDDVSSALNNRLSAVLPCPPPESTDSPLKCKLLNKKCPLLSRNSAQNTECPPVLPTKHLNTLTSEIMSAASLLSSLLALPVHDLEKGQERPCLFRKCSHHPKDPTALNRLLINMKIRKLSKLLTRLYGPPKTGNMTPHLNPPTCCNGDGFNCNR